MSFRFFLSESILYLVRFYWKFHSMCFHSQDSSTCYWMLKSSGGRKFCNVTGEVLNYDEFFVTSEIRYVVLWLLFANHVSYCLLVIVTVQ